jgi:hypothetical protein
MGFKGKYRFSSLVKEKKKTENLRSLLLYCVCVYYCSTCSPEKDFFLYL